MRMPLRSWTPSLGFNRVALQASMLVGLFCLLACQQEEDETNNRSNTSDAGRTRLERLDSNNGANYGNEGSGQANAIGTKAGGNVVTKVPSKDLKVPSKDLADVVVEDDSLATTDNLEDVEDNGGSDIPEATTAESAMVAYATSQMGQRVGNGQCTELAVGALRAAGVGGRYPGFSNTGTYVWGEHVVQLTVGSPLQDLDKIRPGHVLQLEGVSVNGFQAWHHTQVVIANLGNGVITVNEQNMNGKMIVTQRNWAFGSMRSGTVDVWAPSP